MDLLSIARTCWRSLKTCSCNGHHVGTHLEIRTDSVLNPRVTMSVGEKPADSIDLVFR
jgi:hypothetical protein